MSTPRSTANQDVARRTAQREAVLHALRQTRSYVSAQALYDVMNSGPLPVSLATVYRHLNSFVQSGDADTTWKDRHQLFRACGGSAAHVHAVCTACGKDDEVTTPAVISDLAAYPGFAVEHMSVEILGRCDDCRARGSGF